MHLPPGLGNPAAVPVAVPPFHAHGPPPYAVASPHHPQYVRIPAGAGVVAQQVVDEEKDRWRVEAAKWTEHKAEEGIYYYNAESGESTWECPPAVAFKKKIEDSGFAMEKIKGTKWMRVYAADGDFYYHKPETQESVWTLPKEVEETFRQALQEKNGVAHQQEQQKEEKEKEIPAEIQQKTQAEGESEQHADESNRHDADQVPIERESAVQARSEMEMESSEDHMTKVRIALAERALDAVKRKLNDAEGSLESTEASKRPKTDASSSSETVTEEHLADEDAAEHDEVSSEEHQARVEQFKSMLREKKLTPFSKWEKELPRLCVDPRFKILPRHGDRRAVFEAYLKNIFNEELAAKRARSQAARKGYEQLLEEAREKICADTKWSDFEKMMEVEPRFKAMAETSADRKERRALFEALVAPLRQAREKEMQERREEARSGFMDLLTETKEINHSTRWSKVKMLLENDPRYRAVESSDEREKFFDEYLKSISNEFRRRQRIASAEERLKEREKEIRKKRKIEEREMDEKRSKVRLEEATHNFEALLSERIKRPDVSWKESKDAFSNDRRFSSPLLTAEQKEKLFRKHLQKLTMDRSVQFKALLAETDKVHMASSWEDTSALLQDEPRWNRVPDSNERKKIFLEHLRELYEKAKNDFLALLEATNKETMAITTTTTADDWPKIEELIRGDKRYKAFDVRPEERIRLLEDFVAALGRPKPEDKRDKH